MSTTTTTKAQTLEDLHFQIMDAIEKLAAIDYVTHEYSERCWQFKIPAHRTEIIDCIRADYYDRLHAIADALEAMDENADADA